MEYGHFSNDKKEYIITRPDTPTPWINYISNPLGYCGIISQAAGGFSFIKDPRQQRITKYRYNAVPVDRPGRYFYILDEETGEYFSPTWQPVQKKPDFFEARHGLGYTVISSEYSGLKCEVKYFVPADMTCEVWKLRIDNTSGKKRKLSVFSYSEFTMWSEPESRNIQWSLHLPRCSYDGGIYYDFIEPHPAFDMSANKDYVADRPGYGFMLMNRRIEDHECVRDKFIGMYRSESNPEGVEAGKLTNSQLRGGIGCAALRAKAEIPEGSGEDFIVTLGFAETKEDARKMAASFDTGVKAEEALDAVKKGWEEYLDVFRADTPDDDMNTMVNIWNQYQCKTTFDWSRYISYYENGEGRGMGTRDSCQDTLAINSHIKERAKKRVLEILSTTQFETGDCYHQFFPLGGKGDLKGFSDDHLWLVQMVHAYISETGDVKILNEKIKYADSEKKDTVYGHLAAALSYTGSMNGRNGLPLILTADWNDTLHLWMECEKPESVLTAMFYLTALKQMSELAPLAGKLSDSGGYIKKAEETAALINEKCWDGEWYLRGFGSEVIGTKEQKYANIFLNPQVWAVISGAADDGRSLTCMDSVKKYLASDEGVKLIYPPFTEYDQTHGLISRYNTGRKENGIFAHANAWAIIAECMLKRPENAAQYYKNILPVKRNGTAEAFKTEPYIFCQTIASDDAQDKGEGANSWLTGTASWMFVAATQYILGIKPVLNGLKINPCVPAEWEGYRVTRKFRGCVYNFEFVKKGRLKIFVDGKETEGDIIHPSDKNEASVIVEY